MVKPVTAEVALFVVVARPVPDTVDQAPVPDEGDTAFKFVVVKLHIDCAKPAIADAGAEEVMVTCALPEHAPLLTVQTKTVDAPTVKPVTAEVALPVDVATPVPEKVDHVPVPLAAKVAVVELQIAWFVPASGTPGADTVMVTLLLALQAPLVTVHKNVVAAPMVKPVTADVALPVDVATPEPDVVDQTPVPGDGTVAAKVEVVTLHKPCAAPAFAVTGKEDVMVTVLFAEHAPLVTVHRNVVTPPMVRPVTPEATNVGEVTTPVPETVDHAPVAGNEGPTAITPPVVELHTTSDVPAFDVGREEDVMVTELFAVHAPLVTVH